VATCEEEYHGHVVGMHVYTLHCSVNLQWSQTSWPLSVRSAHAMEPELSPSDRARVCESTNKGPLPQKRAEQTILFQGTLSHLQLCTTSDYFAQLPTELQTTTLQLTFTTFFYFHTKLHLLIRIVCKCKAQTLCMRIPHFDNSPSLQICLHKRFGE